MYDLLNHRLRWTQILLALASGAVLITTTAGIATSTETTSTYEVAQQPTAEGAKSTIRVDIVDANSNQPLPAHVVVTNSDGQHPDGSGRGVYSDGRFFAEGNFVAEVPPGETKLAIAHGPHYVPLTMVVEIRPRQSTHIKAKLFRWFSPADRGWFAGDNHVHAQHDENAAVKTDLAYTALQARAGGLNFVTESGSNVSYDDLDQLDTDDFLLRYAAEVRPGPYVGHLNTPGITSPIPDQVLRATAQRPLPAQGIFEAARERGGVVIHTHPMTPRHQLHWMGATEAYSDAVLRNCADLLDVDSNHTQQLWFAMLNMGNNIGVSSYTDCALGRKNTPSPGDRRIYVRADRLDWRQLVESMRAARTMATNGGPVFAFLDVAGNQPGDTILGPPQELQAKVEVQSLNKLRAVELYQDGARVAAFNVRGKKGTFEAESRVHVPQNRRSWLVARAEDEDGKWCLTSPVFFSPNSHSPTTLAQDNASAVLLEISNATRFVELRPQFFAHVIVTVAQDQRLASVALIRDLQPLQVFRPADGAPPRNEQLAVTSMHGPYVPGWIWHPSGDRAYHFQADWPIAASGWYRVEATTTSGQKIVSDSVLFEATNPASHSLSIANLSNLNTDFSLWGYGEDVALDQLQPPFDQGEWWYPGSVYWRVSARFGEHRVTMGWPNKQPVERFRD